MDKIKSNELEISQCSRRNFLKKSTFAGVLLSVSSYGFSSAENLFFQPSPGSAIGSGFNIFSIAIIDDSARLARKSKEISALIQKNLVSDFNLPKKGSNAPHPGNTARLASILPFNKEDFISLLANARENKNKLDDFGEETQKLGFALGWVASNAGNKHLDQLRSENKAISENSYYLDAAILRSKSAGKTKSIKAEDIESLLHQMAPRIFTRFHTFIPDFDDGEGWVLRMAGWRENLNNYFKNLSKAYASPDQENMKKYITGPGIFNPDDEIIKLAHSDQENVSVEQILKAEAKSKYAQTMVEGYKNLKVASDFMEGKINEQQLKENIKS
ncbi:hypothetical protein BH23BAC1_BH23BAC1_49820 [soil metagenome]